MADVIRFPIRTQPKPDDPAARLLKTAAAAAVQSGLDRRTAASTSGGSPAPLSAARPDQARLRADLPTCGLLCDLIIEVEIIRQRATPDLAQPGVIGHNVMGGGRGLPPEDGACAKSGASQPNTTLMTSRWTYHNFG